MGVVRTMVLSPEHLSLELRCKIRRDIGSPLKIKAHSSLATEQGNMLLLYRSRFTDLSLPFRCDIQ
jgi:hypothetical protein